MANQTATACIKGRMNLRELIAINDRIWAENAKKIYLDFSEYKHSSIFDLVFIAHQISYVQKKRNIRIEAIGHDHMTWANGMNFFAVSGTDWGSHIQRRTGDDFNYIPITEISCRSEGRALTRTEMNEQIDLQSAKIAQVLLHQGSGGAYDMIQYAFREIIRNIFEHSGARRFLIAGQYYPKHRNVQIVIADDGQGIPNSLRFNKKFEGLPDKDALTVSLMPGVSGNAEALSSAPANIWQNSGYGLYMVSRIARNMGIFNVISGSYSIFLRNNNDPDDSKENMTISNFCGTLIRLGVPIDDESFAAKLKRWADEGKELAKNISGAKTINASAASLLLRRDFERANRG